MTIRSKQVWTNPVNGPDQNTAPVPRRGPGRGTQARGFDQGQRGFSGRFPSGS